MEQSLLIIQTITGVLSLLLAIKAINLNNQSNMNSNNNYINTGTHNQSYINNNINIVEEKHSNKIFQEKRRYIKYFHWIFMIAFFGTGLYTLFKMYPVFLQNINILDGGITLTNITKLLVYSLQNALLGSLLINIISGLILIITIIIKPYITKRKIPLSMIIVLTNSLIFIDLWNNKYYEEFVYNSSTNNFTNYLIVCFILIIMMIVLANNTILGIYLFDLNDYDGQLEDPLVRVTIILLTIVIFIFAKWIVFYNGLELIQEQLTNYFD
ncbi:hypothetical protein C7J88_07470 [Staphylococcus muscae]|uniref:Uncharacterized protein n=1 Tax=Staphylococcus muscae TaxID=1294 RepID=A0A240BRA9_9STAP|nr:hypothetical protein [Staphylococcus muscae]AVQ34024.1 hypothetical protein C7J88_07470 [Staphylococcus muscae]GGA82376.1 hypothetical protein GCM10007183_03230 [Staphylococcus muscae]SNV98387.1 Uncharacterised protein [Staphylococcus muscae]